MVLPKRLKGQVALVELRDLDKLKLSPDFSIFFHILSSGMGNHHSNPKIPELI